MSAAAAAAFFALTMSVPAQAGMMNMNPGLTAAAPSAVQQVRWHRWHRGWHRHYRRCWRDWRGFRHCRW